MPIQLPNFRALTPQDMGQVDLISALAKGQQLGQNMQLFPTQLQQERVKAQYAQPNAIQALLKATQENQWNPKIWQSEIGLRGAESGLAGQQAKEIAYKLSHPGLLGGEETKTIQSLYDMGLINKNQLNSQYQQNPLSQNYNQQESNQNLNSINNNINPIPLDKMNETVSMPIKTGNPLVDAIVNKPFANANYQRKMTSAFNYVHAPTDAKNYMIAQLAGAGVDPSESINLLSQGYTVPQVLQAKGFDPNNAPEPDFLPTRGNIEKLNQRKAALAEVNSLGKFIREGLGPYSRTIMNYSPSQIVDALSGQDDHKQAMFLAARGLAPELGNVRLMLAQARTGKYAMQSMLNKSMSNISTFQSSVSPKVWQEAQQLMDDQLTDAFGKSEKAYTVGKRKENTEENYSKQSNRTVWTRDANGKLVVGK